MNKTLLTALEHGARRSVVKGLSHGGPRDRLSGKAGVSGDQQNDANGDREVRAHRSSGARWCLL